jgi:hypothetical protein
LSTPDASEAIPAILIFGSARSGTTWVQDVLAEANSCETVFEPLHPVAVGKAERFANLYLPVESPDPELGNYLKSVMIGEFRNVWTMLRTRPDRLFPPFATLLTRKGLANTRSIYANTLKRWWNRRNAGKEPRIVKFVRGNLLVDWIHHRFSLQSAVVVRHPCAVFSSVNQRPGIEWSKEAMFDLLQRYLDQADLIEDRLQGKLGRLLSLRSMAQCHAAVWCIENAWLLKRRSTTVSTIVSYEDLVTASSISWSTLTARLGLPQSPDQSLLAKPSQQARYSMKSQADGLLQISGWQEKLSAAQIADIQGVLDLFEVDSYDTNDVMPSRPISFIGSHMRSQ